MRRKDSTEATVEKVELKTELDALKPIEPKDVIDFEVNEEAEAIKDEMEVLKIFLKLNDYKWGVNRFLKGKGFQVLKDDDWKEYFLKDWTIVKDLMTEVFNKLYANKSAYIKRWDYVLFGEIQIRPYKVKVCTKYGNIELPSMSVDWTTIYFPRDNVLSTDELETYRMYNQKNQDYNKMELEKKIMADLISYTQLWTKTLEQSSELIERIKSDLSSLWTVKYCGFKDWKITLDFPYRMGTDNSKHYYPMVLPPFKIIIDFKNKNISLQWEHPHNLGGSPCLWWELTRIKDQCFKDKDIHWLVVAMAQFWNSFTSNDCGHWDRDPSRCLIRHIRDKGLSFNDLLEIKEVPFEEIFKSIAFYDVNRFTYHYPEFVEKCKDESFLKMLLGAVNKDNQYHLLRWLWYSDGDIKVYRETWTLKNEVKETGGFSHWEYFDDDYDYEDEDDWEEEDDD